MRRVAAVLLISALAGCGGDDLQDGGDRGLQDAVQAYSDAFLEGSTATTYELLSARCQERYSSEEWTALTEPAANLYGSALPFESFEADVSGDMARVTYTFAVTAINQEAEPWSFESGWRQDDC